MTEELKELVTNSQWPSRPVMTGQLTLNQIQVPNRVQVCKSQNCHHDEVVISLFVQIKWTVQQGQGTTETLLCVKYSALGVGRLSRTWTTISQTVIVLWVKKAFTL